MITIWSTTLSAFDPLSGFEPAVNQPNFTSNFTNYKNRYAFVVGISQYNSSTLTLEGPTHDAKGVAKILAERYGFQVHQLIDDKQHRVTKDILLTELDDFKTQIKDAANSLFVFYYSGHGIKNRIVLADGTEWPFTELAKKMAAYQTHHTLLILDACFSGTIFDSKQVANIFKAYIKENVKSTNGRGLERMFSLPVVQAITAGTGHQEVADQVKFSNEFKKIRGGEAASLEQYSPFTAMLIQALAGRIGLDQQSETIKTGTIPSSMLGYQLSQLLAANSQLRDINQLPRFQTLVGEGEILLIPTRQNVLNPRLVGPLYLLDDRYQSLRASAVKTLLSKEEQTNPELVSDALPHLTYSLSDTPTVQKAALDALTQWVDKNGPIEDFGTTISSLTNMLNQTETDDLLKKLAAELLGKLSRLADKNAVIAMEQYINQLLQKWEHELKLLGFTDNDFPPEVREQENIATLKIETEKFQHAMTHLEKRYQTIQWLLEHGIETILADINNKSFQNVNQVHVAIQREQEKIKGLKERVDHTSLALEKTETDLKPLFKRLKDLWNQHVDMLHQYRKQQAKLDPLDRRYKKVNSTLNKLLGQREQIRKEAHKIEEAIKEYLKQKWAHARENQLELNNLSQVWQEIDQFIEKGITFAERHIQQTCSILNQANNEQLLSHYFLDELLTAFLKEWLALDITFTEKQKETIYYQLPSKFLKKELEGKRPLQQKLTQLCEQWTVHGQIVIDWQKIYNHVVNWRELVAEIKGAQEIKKAISPTVEDVEKEIVRLDEDIQKEKQEKEQAEQELKTSKTQTKRLQDKVADTENRFKTVKNGISTTQTTLGELEIQKAEQQALLDVAEKRLKQLLKIRQYLCHQPGGHCVQ